MGLPILHVAFDHQTDGRRPISGEAASMQIKRFPYIGICLLLTVILFTGTGKAQAVYGSIIGTVNDPQGDAVAGATVTVTDLAKGKITTVTTNESGNYTVTHLIPGRYSVKIEAQGYKTANQEVEVRADVAARTDFELEVGAVTEQVTVTSDAQTLSLKTDRAEVSTTFNETQLQELPIFNRNFTTFELLTPGTQQLGWQHAASENPQGSIQIMVNGQHFSGTSFQLDGTDNRDPILGIIVINPTLESVTEAKVTTQNYDAEFGLATAGVVTAQTRSGSNDPHGSAFLFRRNDLLQARDPFSQSVVDAVTGRKIPESLWSQFGGSFGWKIIRDKNFFFVDYQGTRSKEGASVRTTVPTLLARSGDLSEYPNQIFDPTTGNQTTGVGRTPFAGNRIPNSRLSAQALNLIRQLPPPNIPGAGISNNFSASGTDVFDGDQINVRDDHYWSEKLHLFGRYSFAEYSRTKPGAFGFLLGGEGLSGARFAGASDVRNQSLAAGFDYTVSTNTITDFRFGFFRYRVNVLPGGIGTSPAADAGIPGLNVDDFFTSGMPFFNIFGPGGFKLGFALDPNGCNCPLDQQEQQFQFVNNWSFIRGNHTWRTGADIRFAQNLRVPSDRHRSGQLEFNEARTASVAASGLTSGGLGLATFLLGDVTFFTRYVSTVTDAAERQRRWFFYGQDTWRVTQKLTVNYGLRWELIFPERIKEDGTGSLLNLETGDLFVGGVGEVNSHFNVDMSYKAFAPRLGIAYQMTDNTVVRAGYGRSFDIGVFGSIFGHTVTQNLPVLSAQEETTQNFRRVFTLASGPPAPVFPAVPSNGLLPLPNGIFARARPFEMKLPTLDAWNVMVQHQLGRNTSIEVGYVGNKGTHVFAGDGPAFNINQAVSDLSIPDVNQRKPFFNRFGWTQGIDYYCNCADNRYNAMQTKFETRIPGLSILAHYTLQRATNDDADYFFWDRTVTRGPTSFDRTHVLLFSNVFDVPVGRGRRFMSDAPRVIDWILGGWQINSITTWMSGLAFTPTVSGANCSVNSGPCRPDRIGDTDLDDPDQNGWFRVGIGPGTPWAKAAPGEFGDVGRNTLRGPSFFNSDLSFFKNFRITESQKIEFRAEIFNVFNKVNLNNPDACVDCNPTSAGRIFSLAPGARMRNVQFGLRYIF
jgi:outer membrane receptor protein involved in Fe transport